MPDERGFTKQMATDAYLHSSSLPDSQVTPLTSCESYVITDTPSITDQANEVTTETNCTKTKPEEIEKSLDNTTLESNSDTDSDSLSKLQPQNKKIKINLRQDNPNISITTNCLVASKITLLY